MKKSAAEIEAEAAEWVCRSEDPNASADTLAAREAWLAQSPRHQVIYFRLAWGWQRSKELLRPDTSPEQNSSSCRSVGMHHPNETRQRRHVTLAFGVLGMIIFGAIAWRGWVSRISPMPKAQVAWLPQPTVLQVFKTDVGRRQHVVLLEGSEIDLNTASELQVRLTAQQRDVFLVRGEALFTIAHDSLRPFEVSAGGWSVRALGTRFSVRARDNSNVDVLVAQGRVGLGCRPHQRDEPSLSSANCATVLSVGDIATIRSGRTSVTRLNPDELDRRLQWLQGRLDFNEEPLSEVIAEVNRYRRDKLEIVDPTVAAHTISGSVRIQDIAEGNVLVLLPDRIYHWQGKAKPDDIALKGKQR